MNRHYRYLTNEFQSKRGLSFVFSKIPPVSFVVAFATTTSLEAALGGEVAEAWI